MQKAKAITNDIVENTYTQKMILKILVSLLLIIFFVYVYFIGSITFNVLARRSLENNLKVLGAEVSQLEIAYLNKTNEINKNYVLSLGFVENEPDIFIIRSSSDRVAVR
jgi:hypothetical protein